MEAIDKMTIIAKLLLLTMLIVMSIGFYYTTKGRSKHYAIKMGESYVAIMLLILLFLGIIMNMI